MSEPRYRRAIVTGASTGLGAVFATQLAAAGCDPILVARDAGRLRELAGRLRKDHGVSPTVVPADLTVPEQRAQIEDLAKRDARLDLLVNNAGFGTIGPFAELDIEREMAEIELNVVALVRLTHAALPGMIQRGRGAILNVASLAAFVPGPYNATYTATKAYVKSFTESLALELEGSGVHAMVVCPGFTRTEFQERAGLDASRVPSIAWMSAEDVVKETLQALDRREVVFVPGLRYRLMVGALGFTPAPLLRALTKRSVARAVGDGARKRDS